MLHTTALTGKSGCRLGIILAKRHWRPAPAIFSLPFLDVIPREFDAIVTSLHPVVEGQGEGIFWEAPHDPFAPILTVLVAICTPDNSATLSHFCF